MEKRKASKPIADYRLLRASSYAVVALLYLQEMCPACSVLTACALTPAIASRSGPQAHACPCQAHGQGCHWSWFGEEQRDAMHGRTGIRKDARRKKPVGTTTNQIPSAGQNYPRPNHRKWRGACFSGTGACRCIGNQRTVTYTRG